MRAPLSSRRGGGAGTRVPSPLAAHCVARPVASREIRVRLSIPLCFCPQMATIYSGCKLPMGDAMKLTGCDDQVLTTGEYELVAKPLFSFVFAQWLQFFISAGVLSNDKAYRLTIDTWDFDDDQNIEWTAGQDIAKFRVSMADALRKNYIQDMRAQLSLGDAVSIKLTVSFANLDTCDVAVTVNDGCQLAFSELTAFLDAAEDEVTKERNNSF